MYKRVLLFTTLATVFFYACTCNGSANKTSVAERKAEEDKTRNPVKKGRYRCYRSSNGINLTAEDLFILSDKMYQVNEVTGTYVFDKEKSVVKIVDGPLFNDGLLGFYTAKGMPTSGGGHTLESMIVFRKQEDVESDGKQLTMLCNCAERE